MHGLSRSHWDVYALDCGFRVDGLCLASARIASLGVQAKCACSQKKGCLVAHVCAAFPLQ